MMSLKLLQGVEQLPEAIGHDALVAVEGDTRIKCGGTIGLIKVEEGGCCFKVLTCNLEMLKQRLLRDWRQSIR